MQYGTDHQMKNSVRQTDETRLCSVFYKTWREFRDAMETKEEHLIHCGWRGLWKTSGAARDIWKEPKGKVGGSLVKVRLYAPRKVLALAKSRKWDKYECIAVPYGRSKDCVPWTMQEIAPPISGNRRRIIVYDNRKWPETASGSASSSHRWETGSK